MKLFSVLTFLVVAGMTTSKTRLPSLPFHRPHRWRSNWRRSHFHVSDVRVSSHRMPLPVPRIQVPKVNIPEIQIPEFPEIPQIPEIRIPAVPRIREFHDPVREFFRKLREMKFITSSSRHPEWKLTWGWFEQPEVIQAGRPQVRPKPRQPIHRPHNWHSDIGPHYDSLCRGPHYSARRFDSSTWVSAKVENGTSMDVLRRIKEYFNGGNNQGRIIMMSRPLRMTVTGVNGTISATEDTAEEFTLSALVPMNYRRAPTPTDPSLSITFEPQQVYFATHFRLHRRPGTLAIYDEYFDLEDALDLNGELFQHGMYHSAFYETWAEITSDSTRPNPGEILIPAASGENLVCARQQHPQNGIEQCGDSRCPTYEHIEQLRDDIELRRIKGGTYITRTAPACTLVLPAFTNHCALKRYLAGANNEEQRYPSRAPFIHYIAPSRPDSNLCKQTAISAYMLPPNITAAQPTECSGFNRRYMDLQTVPDRDVFVLKFGGRPNQAAVESKVDELRQFLRRQGLGRCFQKNTYAIAVYDHPFNRPPHLNEIYVFKKSGPCRSEDLNGPITEDPTENTTVTTSRMTTEPILFEEEVWPSTTMTAVMETTSSRTTTSGPDQVVRATTEHAPLVEVDLTLESNNVDLSDDLIPYRFSGNQTDFPEDFPVDIFVY